MHQKNSHEDLGISTLQLPFYLPPTPEADFWLMELEFIDFYEGELDELRELAERAPSRSAHSFLKGAITIRENLRYSPLHISSTHITNP